VKQPELMDECGTKFHGRAKTDNGNIWWYEERLSDGSIKRHVLLPVHYEVSKDARSRS
jgi:hypothetical protein